MRFKPHSVCLLFTLSLFAFSHVAHADAPPALAVIGTIPGPDGGWDVASIDAAARRLYVAHGDAVTVVDLDTGKLTPKLLEGQRLHAIVPLPDGKALATNGGADTVTLFEAATGKAIATIPTGKNPDVAAFDPKSGLVLVMDGRDADITLIDPKTATSAGRIALGGKPEFGVADGKGRAFVNLEDKGEIAVIDIGARKVLTQYKLPDCEEPSGLALDPASGILLAACDNQKAVAINAKDGSLVASLPIGKRPDTAIFDAAHKVFYIPCGEGTLAVIAEKDGALTSAATVTTVVGARTGALDPKTGKIYLPTADFKLGAAGERPTPVPGTFRIVIVGPKT